MKGLIIKPHWADLILNGDKDMEIRGSRTSIRGEIAIIKSGTGMIYGTAELYDCREILPEEFRRLERRHRVDKIDRVPYKRIFGWTLYNPKRFDQPIPYNHPQGAVIWVNLAFNG